MFDISALNPSELAELERHAAARRSEIAQEHRAKTIAELTATAKAAGYDIRELFNPVKPVAKARVKYRNDENAKETWAGRGKKPKWLAARIAAGATLDQFKVA